MLRLKMRVNAVNKDTYVDKTEVENVQATAVYSSDPESANYKWSKYTPAATLTICISNPAAFGAVKPGDFVFVDLTPTDEQSY